MECFYDFGIFGRMQRPFHILALCNFGGGFVCEPASHWIRRAAKECCGVGAVSLSSLCVDVDVEIELSADSCFVRHCFVCFVHY